MRWIGLACFVAVACGAPTASRAPRSSPQVLKYSFMTAGRHSGDALLSIEADGRRLGHFTFNDRGRGPDIRSTLVLDDAGAPQSFRATGQDYWKAPIDERLEGSAGTLSWQSTGERGKAAAGSGWFVPLNDALTTNAALAQALLRAKDHRVKLLPAGEAWIEDDSTREVEIGGVKQRLRRLAIAGFGYDPGLSWFDEHGELFGFVSAWSSMVPVGAESVIPTLLADDEAWKAARASRLAGQLAHRPPAAGLAITHARLFDSERRTVVPDATVIVVGDRITAVGGASTPVPAGARVIDAHGRTLLPGLWDMHVHIGATDGILQLAAGVTTVRDLGNDIADLTARMARSTPARRSAPGSCAPV